MSAPGVSVFRFDLHTFNYLTDPKLIQCHNVNSLAINPRSVLDHHPMTGRRREWMLGRRMRVDNFEGIVLQMRLIIGTFRSFNAAIVKLEELTAWVAMKRRRIVKKKKRNVFLQFQFQSPLNRLWQMNNNNDGISLTKY